MAIARGTRFPMQFEMAFPKGLVLVGEIEPVTEYQSQEDRQRGREARPRLDERTGMRLWKGTATDPSETRAKRASFEVLFIADVQPVPTTEEVLPGMRPLELDGLEVEPRVTGQGEYKTLGYQVWATGIRDNRPAAGTRSRQSSTAAESAA